MADWRIFGKALADKGSIRKAFPYWAVTALGFYLLPILIRDTGSAMLVLLCLLPALCSVSAVLYGVKYPFRLWYVVSVPVLFIPSVFVFYDADTGALLFYCVGYTLVAVVGYVIGSVVAVVKRS